MHACVNVASYVFVDIEAHMISSYSITSKDTAWEYYQVRTKQMQAWMQYKCTYASGISSTQI